MTEQKIREAFEKAMNERAAMAEEDRGPLPLYLFRAGYLALLNELITVGDPDDPLYMLPEGVTK